MCDTIVAEVNKLKNILHNIFHLLITNIINCSNKPEICVKKCISLYKLKMKIIIGKMHAFLSSR